MLSAFIPERWQVPFPRLKKAGIDLREVVAPQKVSEVQMASKYL